MEIIPKRNIIISRLSLEEKTRYDRICAYLKKFPVTNQSVTPPQYAWVPKKQIQFVAATAGIHCHKNHKVWGLLDTTANIGMRWNKDIKDVEYRYYEPQEGHDLMQKTIDEF